MDLAAPRPLLDDPEARLWRLLLLPQGRIGRGLWWWYAVAAPLAVATLLHALLGIAQVPFGLAEAAVNLLLFWPTLMVSAKRWHDLGRSGWWALVMLLPVLGWLWALVANGMLAGNPGPNRYGPAP